MSEEMALPCGAKLVLELPDHLVVVSWETLWSRFESIHSYGCSVCKVEEWYDAPLST
jgi:hypothetical protein